jgi:ABC-type nitrate/sulfonate/bicarbonate transport system substrate-binding protein
MSPTQPASGPTTSPLGAPEQTHVRIGFVALSDAAPLIAAEVLEFGHRHGLTLELCRQPSWAAVRDKLLAGELDAAHALYGLVVGVQMGIGGPQADLANLMVLNRNGQAITLSEPLTRAFDACGNLRQALGTLGRKPIFAQTFPTGTHAMWLYYWLAAQGVDPLRDIESVVIPPPQMTAALADRQLDGFCCGEPWHGLAEARRAGTTVAISSQIWPDHPEKVLACRRDFVDSHPNTARALVSTLLEACRWLDDPLHRTQIASWMAAPDRVGVSADLIAARLGGQYDAARFSPRPAAVSFFQDGSVNYPRPSEALWFLTQYRRWGMLGNPGATASSEIALSPIENDPGIAAAINQTAVYAEAAAAVDVKLPDPITRTVLCDGRAWDGFDPIGYQEGFEIRA